jgi:hypothetical protein
MKTSFELNQRIELIKSTLKGLDPTMFVPVTCMVLGFGWVGYSLARVLGFVA